MDTHTYGTPSPTTEMSSFHYFGDSVSRSRWVLLKQTVPSCWVLSSRVHCLRLNSCRPVRQHRRKLVTDDHRRAPSPFCYFINLSHGVLWIHFDLSQMWLMALITAQFHLDMEPWVMSHLWFCCCNPPWTSAAATFVRQLRGKFASLPMQQITVITSAALELLLKKIQEKQDKVTSHY